MTTVNLADYLGGDVRGAVIDNSDPRWAAAVEFARQVQLSINGSSGGSIGKLSINTNINLVIVDKFVGLQNGVWNDAAGFKSGNTIYINSGQKWGEEWSHEATDLPPCTNPARSRFWLNTEDQR